MRLASVSLQKFLGQVVHVQFLEFVFCSVCVHLSIRAQHDVLNVLLIGKEALCCLFERRKEAGSLEQVHAPWGGGVVLLLSGGDLVLPLREEAQHL